jgi:hypothetical protein
LRLELDRLPLDRLPLRPFEDERLEDERPFAVVRLRPPLDDPLPFDEPLLRLDFERLPDDELPLRLEADDLDLRAEELRLRELDEERLFLTSPSSIRPRQDPVSSSSIIT